MNEPLVSIGVPVYNGGKYIRECLESIEKQTYKNWECIIVENASKDDTPGIVEEFKKRDKRFKVVENSETVPQTENWNISFANISPEAKYFKILCADDWIFPEYLERIIPVMEQDESVGIGTSYRIDGKDVRCDGVEIYDGNVFPGIDILREQLRNRLDITGSVSTVVYRLDTLKKLPYYPAIFLEDVYHIDTVLAYDIMSFSNVGFAFQVLSYTRRHNETYTSNITERFKTSLYLRELMIRKYLHLLPELKGKYKNLRLDYAYFLMKKKIQGDKKCIDWHRKYLTKKFTMGEKINALISRNIFARQVQKVTRRKR
jgi:glycosyltransferase involved in cell wall biosynthesis